VQAKLECNHFSISSNNVEEIKQSWIKLESCAKNSIFTNWNWIYNWLTFINFNAFLVQVSFNNEIVGLGFLTKNSQKKYGITSKQLWLNRTGDDKKDQIWSEYNDILCTNGMEYAIRSAILDHFEKHLPDYDELIIGASRNNIVQTPHSQKLIQHTSWKTSSYSTKLQPDFAEWKTFLQSLSKNSRSQIKRSASLYGGVNNIQVTSATSETEALTFFHDAGKYHKVRWKTQKSGFKNPLFVSFHENFIKENFSTGHVDILKVHNNNQTICYLYNLIYKNTVYFYLSGIEYSNDNKLKPGLVAHSLAIARYAKLGYKEYDFMGGEGRYKNSLSNQKSSMIISNFRRNSIPFILSSSIRKAKAIYLQARQ